MPDTGYKSENEDLPKVLGQVADGSAQLPEFQRDWRWDDDRIRSLLTSIFLSYPVGAVMMLKVGDEARFKYRPLEGAQDTATEDADRLILDGQQRLTSLFQSLLSGKPVDTRDQRKKNIKRWYYIDMEKALDEEADREEVILSVPMNRIEKIRNGRDFSKTEYEHAEMVFPLSRIFSYDSWSAGYRKFWSNEGMEMLLKKDATWEEFRTKVLERFKNYDIPVITLGRDTPLEAVCQVFEKVNTGGMTLDVFELLTAMFAADKFNLRKDWKNRKEEMKGFSAFKRSVLDNVSGRDFLQAATLLATQRRGNAIRCNRADMLNLTLTEYQDWADLLMEGFKRAEVFLHSEGIFDPDFLPYGSQLIPLAAIYTVLGRDLNQSEHERLARWYWCGVFGELYGSATESRFANDLPEVVEWIRGGDRVPQTVEDAVFSAPRLLSLKTRNSAAYKGMYSLLLRKGPKDWMTGVEISIQHYFDRNVHIHHIFPRKWCESKRLDEKKKMWNSIVNKTPLTSSTNQQIGGSAPSKYTADIEKKADITAEVLDKHLDLHCIDPDHLRNDEYDEFFKARKQALTALIVQAMGKRAVTDDLEEGEDDEDDDEE